MTKKGKIINDPVYGFIRFPEPELMQIIDHKWFQRLRYIRQMGMAHLVYPGAVHTRFHHSLGASHLAGNALSELRIKGVDISDNEYTAARIAILMHDIGHGPFSHALEHSLVDNISHEQISSLIMEKINEEFDGLLDNAIHIFDQSYPKKYLHQLISSQLDVDRMDYLNRDSFYTGVSEGVIGYDRILQMLTVRNNNLMVEEKGVHSVEKFIIARRLMYWQVYLHKTVLSAELLIINILKRAKELARMGENLFCTPDLAHFLYNKISFFDFKDNKEHLEQFCLLDDIDISSAIKVWCSNKDITLSTLCKMIMERRLYKVQLSTSLNENLLAEKKIAIQEKYGFDEDTLKYFVFSGITTNHTYDVNDERIQIAMKDGTVKDISEIDNPIVNKALAMPVQKSYICYIQH